MAGSRLESFVDDHLNLQVELSYDDHHAFLVRHGLLECRRVLDVGTGNGTFAARLSDDHPTIEVVGIDKRAPCVESCKQWAQPNFSARQVDLFARKLEFDFGEYDGVLMRYFLLHVDHAHKILELLRRGGKRPSRLWVIDLDWSQFTCTPMHPAFEALTELVRSFCAKVSVDTAGGQKVVPLLRQYGFEDIVVEAAPFTSFNMPREKFTQYLRQEVLCYARMIGDHPAPEILRFIDHEVRTGACEISYGMCLVRAKLS